MLPKTKNEQGPYVSNFFLYSYIKSKFCEEGEDIFGIEFNRVVNTTYSTTIFKGHYRLVPIKSDESCIGHSFDIKNLEKKINELFSEKSSNVPQSLRVIRDFDGMYELFVKKTRK